ncbi:MAG: signal peptidase II [Holosporales bacterium]|jgi:signal peptidase II|nr:signal peptidase II [Holosporales bacterium]
MRDNVNTASVKGGFVLLCVLIIDQITKSLVINNLSLHEIIAVCPCLNIVHFRNIGISFGMLSNGNTWQLAVIWTTVGALLVYLIRQFVTATHWIPSVCIGGIIGGALGNVADRVIYGSVIDFIDCYIKKLTLFSWTILEWHWPAFNVADSAIVVGVCCLMLYSLKNNKGSTSKRR